MFMPTSRRQFLTKVGAAAAGVAVPLPLWIASAYGGDDPGSRVVIARDDALTRGRPDEHGNLLNRLLDASMQRLTQSADASAAWRQLFKPTDRVGIKVNTLGFATEPAVVNAVAAGLAPCRCPRREHRHLGSV